MPIKFACSSCKNVMTVDNKFAGKAGKCNKCGAAVTVPNSVAPAPGAAQVAAAPSASATAVPAASSSTADSKAAQIAALNTAPPPSAGTLSAAGSLSHVMDELTESDFSRKSPFHNVYTPPKPKSDDHSKLKRAASTAGGGEEEKKPKLGADGKPLLTGILRAFGILDIIQAIAMYGLVIAIVVSGVSFLDQVKEYASFLTVGTSLLIIVLGFLATLMMASGLGLLTKQTWGYGAAVFVYPFLLGTRLVVLLMSFSKPIQLIAPGLGIVTILLCTAYLFRKVCRDVFGIKSNKLAMILAGAGLGVSLLIGGLLYLLGSLSSASA